MSEEQYNLFISEMAHFRNELEQNEERLSEISEMISRFELLKSQNTSDISRIDNIDVYFDKEKGDFVINGSIGLAMEKGIERLHMRQ